MSAQQKKHPFDFKILYGLGFSTQNDEIVVDFFCGGGGACTGLEMGLGRAVNVAKNHSLQAFSMLTVSHPGAVHFSTDVFEGDPDTECGGMGVDWLHMSPNCTHHRHAAGGQPRKREIRKPFTKTQQIHMCGNSESPPPMAALARANDPWRAIELQAVAA